MNVGERAAQIWPVLALAARNRQVLSYPILGRLIGVPQEGLGQLLEPIQSYCIREKFPPLTVLVVGSKTGMPSIGFIAAHDVPKAQAEVFSRDWLKHKAPTPETFANAVRGGDQDA
jgi:hypothetical protein